MIPTWLKELQDEWDKWNEELVEAYDGPMLMEAAAFFKERGFIIIKPIDPVIDQVLDDDPDSPHCDEYVFITTFVEQV